MVFSPLSLATSPIGKGKKATDRQAGRAKPPARTAPPRGATKKPEAGRDYEDEDEDEDDEEEAKVRAAVMEMSEKLARSKRQKKFDAFESEMQAINTKVHAAIEQELNAAKAKLSEIDEELEAEDKRVSTKLMADMRGMIGNAMQRIDTAKMYARQVDADLQRIEEEASQVLKAECAKLHEDTQKAIAKHKAATREAIAEHALPHRELVMSIDGLLLPESGAPKRVAAA